jgi:cell division septal protein FtsQ
MRRRSSKRKSKKRSKAKQGHAYEIATARLKLSSRPLVGHWHLRESTVLSMILLAALTLLTSQFFTTYRFYVYEATVQGNRFVKEDEIYAASDLEGMSMFWINPEKAEADISNLPGVREARVNCRLPNQVTIEVLERQPQGVWQKGEARYWFDDLGIIFPLRSELQGMLLIQDERTSPLEVGNRIDSEIITSALELQQFLPEATVFRFSENEGFIFEERGYPVYFGTGDIAEKVASLNALVQDLASKGVTPEFVDVRFKESLCYR